MEAFPSNTAAMDTKMDVDVSKPSEPHRLSLTTDTGSIPTLDGWIESLMNCKQLSEADVSRLCDRVCKLERRYRQLLTHLGERSAARRVQCTASGELQVVRATFKL